MSATEQATEQPIKPVKAPAKKRAKKRAKAKNASAPKAPKTESEVYAGLTVADCCKGCGPAGCVISGSAFCGHPRKGGASHCQNVADSLRRFNEAQRVLGKAMVDARYE